MQNSVTFAERRPASIRPLAATGGAASIMSRAIAAHGAPDATTQDQIDSADTAFALGYPEVARLLYDAAFLRAGFSRSSLRSWASIAERTGLWPDAAMSLPALLPTTGFAVDVALAQLRDLMAGEAELPPLALPDPGPATLETLKLPLPSTAVEQPEHALAAPTVVDLLATLCDALRRDDVAALAEVLEQVRSEVLEPSGSDVADRPVGSILDLAALAVPPGADVADCLVRSVFDQAASAVLDQMRAFFLLHHDLCWAPFGSPALFAAAAKLDEAALGPYFTSVGRLLRSPKDLFGLIDLAGRDMAASASRLQRWPVLLAIHLDHDTRVLVADEMGDRGLTSALSGLLGATRRSPARGTYLFWAIRDAALDNGEVALAAAAQTGIVGLTVTEAREWIVLAEILGTGGAFVAARTAITEARKLDPYDDIARERMEALQTGEFERFHVLSGFSSPPWRVALRARHRPTRQATS